MGKILVTGASGFVGRPTCLSLHSRGFSVRAFSRSVCNWPVGIQGLTAPALTQLMHYNSAFDDVECVLHLAGRAHVMRESSPDPLSAFNNVNFLETLQFARQAALAGVRRFVFVSSIKVNGEHTSVSFPFTELSIPDPSCPYALSKYYAEQALSDLASEAGMEVVIVRPPLIYGPDVKGNFRLMMKLLAQGVPLPLASVVNNRRSFIALDNLIDFLILCATHASAAGKLFLVSDQFDVSTVELIQRLGIAMGISPRLFPVPLALLELSANILSKSSVYHRLCGSLVVDSSSASRLLGWSPPLSFDEGLHKAACDFVP